MMKNRLLLLFLLAAQWMAAQNIPTIELQDGKMRAPLLLQKGGNALQLCGLEPGNTYMVVANVRATGQLAHFEFAEVGRSAIELSRLNAHKIRFVAEESCVSLNLKAASRDQGPEVPMYLSVRCETCTGDKDWLQELADQAVLQTQGGLSAQQLVQDVLVGGGCFQISNVTSFGSNQQFGTFSNGLSNVGFSSGVILSTGNRSNASGPNNSGGVGGGDFGNSQSDPDLETLATDDINDKAVIEFDFVPTQSQVVFEYVFASEEYCEYVNTAYNDVFGFFISGPGISGTKNLALIPGGNIPITINNVNHLSNSSYYIHNDPVVRFQCPTVPPATGVVPQELEYDGLTKKMVAVADVIPCQTYHIKLAIADVGDHVWDSAVFLKANSFDAGGAVLASPAYANDLSVGYENCGTGNIRFKRGNGDSSQPLPISFTVAGSATPGVDYVPLVSPVVIPAGQTEILLPVDIIPDGIAEGQEAIVLLVDNSCSCTQSSIEFLINDRPLLQSEITGEQNICIGDSALFTAITQGGVGPFRFSWEGGFNTAIISPQSSGIYTVTVSDVCQQTATAATELQLINCQPSGCDADTYIKTLGIDGQNVRGYNIISSQDGNFYVGGMKQDSALIIKMTPDAVAIWTRTFDVKDGVIDNISDMLIDADGMLVGCGQSGDVQPGVSGFVFRYNPATNNMLWINTFEEASPYVMGMVELPNGNYLLYDNPHQPQNDNRMMEITKADGTIDFSSPLTRILHLGTAENFNSAIVVGNHLYGVGRYTNGPDFGNMRNALSRIDLNNGNVDWTRLSHVSPDNQARLYGMDVVEEGNNLISVAFGSETDATLSDSRIFLQKTSSSGSLVWLKSFDVTETSDEVVDEIVSVPDGYILYARSNFAPGNLYLIKTDKDGALQWSKKIDYGFNDFVGIVSTFQSQILLNGNHLYMLASTAEAGANSQMLLVKTDLDGTVQGNCNYIQALDVHAADVLNPVNFSVTPQELPVAEETPTIVRTPKASPLVCVNQCHITIEEQFSLQICPGTSVEIGGNPISQDTVISLSFPGDNGCDTLRTWTVTVLPYQTQEQFFTFCPGQSVNIGGVTYDQTGIVLDTLPGLGGACDTILTYHLEQLQVSTHAETISLCPGASVSINGVLYSAAGVVVDTLTGANGCDSIATYTIEQLPYQTRAESISFCPGGSVSIAGQVYTDSGVVVDTLAGTGGGCDTIVTYTLTKLPYQTRAENISFCPGASVTIDGQVYTQSGTVVDTLFGAGTACDTIVTYHLTLLVQPTRSETIEFCPGETITLYGVNYTQPGTVTLVLPSSTGGCDTIATYIFKHLTPAPSNVSINCPAPQQLTLQSGISGIVVNYAQPTAASDCPCPGLDLQLSSGLPSGSTFPLGVTQVCYTVKDSCGQSATCCFNVSVQEEGACDARQNGCMKFELLTITEDVGKNRTYRIRVTNNCAAPMLYAAIQIPDGLVAKDPANLSTYVAPSGRSYSVRNPNYTPQYSVRFASQADSIRNGQSEIFRYTLPAQANVTYINIVARLQYYTYIGAHINTFYCPIGITPSSDKPAGEGDRDEQPFEAVYSADADALLMYPNPTDGVLFADLSPWQGQKLEIRILDSRGQQMVRESVTAPADFHEMRLSEHLSGGLYVLEVLTENGERYSARFVLAR